MKRNISDKYYDMANINFMLDHGDEVERIGAYWVRDWLAYTHQSGYQSAAARFAKERGWKPFTFKLRGSHSSKIIDYGVIYARSREAAIRLICAGLEEVQK